MFEPDFTVIGRNWLYTLWSLSVESGIVKQRSQRMRGVILILDQMMEGLWRRQGTILASETVFL